MPLPKTRLTLRAILFLVVMFTALSSVPTLRKRLTHVSTPYHQKETRHLNDGNFFTHSGLHWSNVTSRSLSARMDGAGADESDWHILELTASTGLHVFSVAINNMAHQSPFTLPSEARGNGPDGWTFGPPRNDFSRILDQLNDDLMSTILFAGRDHGWTNLDAVQDRPYWLLNLEHPPTNAVCNGIITTHRGERVYVADHISTPWNQQLLGTGTDPTVPIPNLALASDLIPMAYGYREHALYLPTMPLDEIKMFIFPNIVDGPHSYTVRIMNIVLNMNRPAGTAPVTLRRFPGHTYRPEYPEASGFMALAGTWQAVTVAALYSQHQDNFRFGVRRFHISSINIFNDENDRPAMAIRVTETHPHETVRIGRVSILDHLTRHPEPEGNVGVNGVNGVAQGGPSAAQGHQGQQPGPHGNVGVNGVNGVAHGGPVAAQGQQRQQGQQGQQGQQSQQGQQPRPYINGVPRRRPTVAQGQPGPQSSPHGNGMAHGGSAPTQR